MKDKKKVSIIVGVFLLVLITVGVTYAFFSYIGTGSTENTISSDSITFLYEEIDQQGSGIGITDALPVEDSTGKSGQAFNFRIISNTNTNISIPYEITVRQKPGTDDIGDIVKLYLTKVDNNNNEEEVKLSKYSELTTVTKNNHQEKLLHTDKVPASNNEYNQRYRLRMWIDNETSFNEVTTPAHCSDNSNKIESECTSPLEWIPESTSYPYNNKTFAVTVNVYSTGHVQTQQDIEAASRTDITSFSVNNTTLTGSNNLYETELAPGTNEATINIETANPYTKVVIEKTDSTYTNVVSMNNIQKLSTAKKVSLSSGDNYYRIRLTSEDTTSNSELHLRINVTNEWTYSYNSNAQNHEYTFNAPVAGTYKLEVWGASGGSYNSTFRGGYGGYSVGEIALTANQTVYINVGSAGAGGTSNTGRTGGYNGGGNAPANSDSNLGASSGGGATHMALVTKSGQSGKTGELKYLEEYKGTLNDNGTPSDATDDYYVSNDILIVAGGGGGVGLNSYYVNGNTYTQPTFGDAGGYMGVSGKVWRTSPEAAVGWTVTPGGEQTKTDVPYMGQTTYTSVGSFGLGATAVSSGGGGGFYGGSSIQFSGGGSGYIANPNLTNKKMFCYNCDESNVLNLYTVSTTGSSNERDTTNCQNGYSSNPVAKCAKVGDGYARITYIGN